MPSRMEKYYSSVDTIKRRSNKNVDLYQTIYDEAEYNNIEGISILEKNEEIDLDKIKELIKSRELDKKPKIIKQAVEIPSYSPIEEEKNYDIRDVLDKAKEERPEEDRNFSNTQYNILKSISLKDNLEPKKYIEDDEELKTMIDSITNTSKLNKTGDLLDYLKTTKINKCSENLLNSIEEEPKEEKQEIDKTFFTSSLNFDKNDFEELKEISTSIRKNHVLTKILLLMLITIIIGGMVFAAYILFK